ncbi:MAG: transcriptional repressor [Bacteroidota bacterium]
MSGTDTSLKNILKRHKIRQTSGRVDILSQFWDAQCALSQPDLERNLRGVYDRVTIYRTLTLYLDKGILHKVLDDAGATKYALCTDTCSEHDHNHEHVHFKCTECGTTSCISELKVPAIALPQGYILKESNLLLSGVCVTCNA